MTRRNSTSSKYVIDAYAWIEYFKASKQGSEAREYIEGENSATPTIVVAELSRKFEREIASGNETQEGRAKRLEFIQATSTIVDLDFEIAAQAGQTCEDLNAQAKGLGLADAIIFCTAKRLKAKIVTGDEHFRQLPNVIFLKE